MEIADLVTTDKTIQNGSPVFAGTRVPIKSLFWHLESGITIEKFLEDYPTVSKEQVFQLLELTNKMFLRT